MTIKTIQLFVKQMIKMITNKTFGPGAFKLIRAIIYKKNISLYIKKYFILLIRSKLGLINYFIDIKKMGLSKTLGRYLFNKLPIEIKKIYITLSYISKNTQHGTNKVLIENLWRKFRYLSNDDKKSTLDVLISQYTHSDKDEVSKQILNHNFSFRVNSPESQNFSQARHIANIYKCYYQIPIRGVLTPYRKYYEYKFTTMRSCKRIVLKALSASDYGREVYSKLRKPLTPQMKKLVKTLYYNN